MSKPLWRVILTYKCLIINQTFATLRHDFAKDFLNFRLTLCIGQCMNK